MLKNNGSMLGGASEQPSEGITETAPWPPQLLAWSVVILLSLLYCLSFIDRMILTLLVEPIKADLGLNDTQLGMLHGLAFALFYATLGYPLGLAADRYSRKWLITGGVFLWITMTALSAFAKDFWTLFFCRMGLGLGEAALSPAAMSLIADYFRPEKRARASSIYIAGASFGGGMAIIVGGWLGGIVSHGATIDVPLIGDMRAWQFTLLAVSVPGFLLGALFMLVPEPVRRKSAVAERATGLISYLVYRKRLLSLHLCGMALASACTFGFNAWMPSLLIRRLNWSLHDIAIYYGPLVLVMSVGAMILSGVLADRGVRSGDSARTMKIAFWCMIILMVTGAWITLIAHDAATMLPALALLNIASAAPFGVSLAALLATTPNRFRGQITAIYLFGLTFGGFAVGPPLAGYFSDYVFPYQDGLAHALALLGVITLPGAALMLGLAIKPYRIAVKEMAE